MVEMLVYAGLVGVLVVWLLLPLVPAILLYWLFPDQQFKTTGWLANFKINATGAFGGYLVLFAAMIPFVKSAEDHVGSFLHPCWMISGKLKILNSDNSEIHSPDLFSAIRMRTVPDSYSFGDPEYVVTVRADDSGDLPPITLFIPDIAGFTPQDLDVESRAQAKRSSFYKTIKNVELTFKRIPVNASYDSHTQ